MPDLEIPHVFVDGPGNTASGEQVSANFEAVRTNVNALWAQVVTVQAFRWYRASPLSVSRNNPITWDQEDYDYMTGGVSPGSTVTIPTAGLWNFHWHVEFTTALTGGKLSSLLTVGGTTRARGVRVDGDLQAASNEYYLEGAALLSLAAGAQVQLSFDSNFADNMAISTGATSAFIEGLLVRPT